MNSQHDPLDFRSARILVIGDVMLDQYWLGDTSRISPEAPVPVIRVTASETRLGGAANAALNAHSLGAAVTLAGIAGNDEHGAQLKKLLGEKGITDHLHTAANARTISKLRMISRNQQLVRADFEEETPAEVVADFTTRCIEAPPAPSCAASPRPTCRRFGPTATSSRRCSSTSWATPSSPPGSAPRRTPREAPPGCASRRSTRASAR